MRATCLLDAATLHKAIKPICACGHSASFHPHGLWWHFERRHWDDSLRSVRKRFWCIICRSSARRKIMPKALELVRVSENDIVLPLPPDEVWKRVVRSLR